MLMQLLLMQPGCDALLITKLCTLLADTSAVLMEEHYQDLAKLLEEYNQGKITTTAVCSRMPHTTSRLQADDFRVGFGTFQTTFRTENAPYPSIAP